MHVICLSSLILLMDRYLLHFFPADTDSLLLLMLKYFIYAALIGVVTTQQHLIAACIGSILFSLYMCQFYGYGAIIFAVIIVPLFLLGFCFGVFFIKDRLSKFFSGVYLIGLYAFLIGVNFWATIYILTAQDGYLIIRNTLPQERVSNHARRPPLFFFHQGERVNALTAAGSRFAAEGRLEKARYFFKKAMDIALINRSYLSSVIEAQMRARLDKDALDYLAISSGGRAKPIDTCYLYLSTDQLSKANECWDKLENLVDPLKQMEFPIRLAEAYFKAGQMDQARILISEANTICMTLPDECRKFGLLGVAIWQAKLDELDKAIATVLLIPEDHKRIEGLNMIALERFQLSDREGSRKVYNQAIDLARKIKNESSRDDALVNIAEAQFSSHFKSDAIKTIQLISAPEAKHSAQSYIDSYDKVTCQNNSCD